MKLFVSVLLGAIACLGASAPVNAAGSPSKKPAPVDYVRVCSQHGQGFFHVPGSDACIRIGGRVRVGTLYSQTNRRNFDSISFSTLARINLDVRTDTPYGMVRAYLRYSLRRAGNNFSDSFNNRTTGVRSTGGLNVAYIQFAGLTAGRLKSFFDFYGNDNNLADIRSSDRTTQLVAYTANFGNGWTLAASLEDSSQRRIYLDPRDDRTVFPAAGGSGVVHGVGRSAGQSAPDVVGALMVDQGWGAAQVSAALHQVRPAFFSYTGNNGATHNFAQDTEYGFALLGGVKVKLPMVAPGDELWFEASYADGATDYLGAGNYSLAQGDIALPLTDAFVSSDGRLRKTRGWSVVANLLHYWTPSVRQNVFASFMRLNYGGHGYTSATAPGLGVYNTGFVDASELRAGVNLIWSPTRNFDIGVEVLYTRLDPKGRVISQNNGGPVRTVSSDAAWQGRLRIQRDF